MALAYLTINLDAFTGDDHPPISQYSTITLDPGADHIDEDADVIHVRSVVVSLDQQGKAATANGVPCVDGRVPIVAGVMYAVSAPNVLRDGPHYIPALTAGQVVDLSDYITPGAPLTPDQAAILTARIKALEATPPGGGVTDHGALTGLGEDDHAQYALADGTRGAFAAPLGADDNYVTDAEKTALHAHSNKAALDLVSGTNTGDQVLPTWSTISGKPAVVAEGATQADARAAIGAGTSNLAIGTTGTTAAAGNRAATETDTGMVELATTTEATTGTDTVRAVTPAGVKAVADTKANVSHTHPASQVSDSTATGRALLTAADAAAARTTLGLGTAATTAATAYATAAQGAKADTAAQPADLSAYATTGDVADAIAASSSSKADKASLSFNVKDYGATGDGATNDTTSITAALTAARAVKGEVIFPPGTYMIASTLNPAGCKLRGYGATLKSVAAVVGFNMLQATTDGFSVYGLTLDLNKANTTDPAATANGLGIYVYRAAGGDCGDFTDVKVYNAWGAAVRIGSVVQTDSKFALNTRATITNLTCDNVAYGVYINGGRDVSVIGGTFTNLHECGVQDNSSLRTTVSGVVVDTAGDHGIISQYGYGTSVTGNTCITNWSHGITLDPTKTDAPGISQSVYGTVSGNVCANNGLVSGSGQGIYAHNAADVAITGNTCRNNQGAGIALDGLRCAVSGNTLTQNGLYGLELRGVSGTDHGGHAIGMNVLNANGTDFFESQYQVPNVIAPTSYFGAVKAASTVRTTTTVTADDPELTIPNVPVGVYAIEAFLVYDAATTADLRTTWSLPAGATVLWTGGGMATSATTFASAIENRPTPGAFGIFGGVGVGTQVVARPLGTLTVVTSGTVALAWAQGASDATDTTLVAGSHISLRRIA